MTRRRFAETGLLAMFASALGNAYGKSAPISPFGARSTAEEITASLDLTGMTAVVTGCNSGVGYETMRVLALRGAHIIGTARTAEKGREACRSIKGRATPAVLELTDFDSVVACAAAIERMTSTVDMLICNAGIVLELAKRLGGTNATSNCVTPGHVRTNILRNVKTPYGNHARSVEQGAATLCYVATNPALKYVSGEHFKDCNPAEQSAYQTDETMAARLWKVSEELTREFLG